MTIEDIFRRVVRAHLRILLVCLVVPLLAVLALPSSRQGEWVGSVRLQASDTAPTSSTEADGISSRVLAIATTPEIVRRALGRAHVERDAQSLAQHSVSAQRLGGSAVVEIGVTDTDPRASQKIAVQLGRQVVRFMNAGNQRHFDTVLATTDHAIAVTKKRRSAMVELLSLISGRSARESAQLRVQAQDAALDRLATQRSSLVLADATRQRVVLINQHAPDVAGVPSTVVPRSALALLLGFFVGLAVAVMLESLRPRVASVRAVGRSLGAPVLGDTTAPASTLSKSVTLAARRQEIVTVIVMAVDDRDEGVVRTLVSDLANPPAAAAPDLSADRMPSFLAASLDHSAGSSTDGPGDPDDSLATASPPARAGAGGVRTADATRPARRAAEATPDERPEPGSGVTFTDLAGLHVADEEHAGVLVLSPSAPLQSRFDELNDVLRGMRWPVIGIVQVAPQRSRWGRS